jgi:hypothetical protein
VAFAAAPGTMLFAPVGITFETRYFLR